MMEPNSDSEIEFAQGDLDAVMERYDHVRQWVLDFEEKHGSRPYYYGALDRDARTDPINLIYLNSKSI